MTDRRRVAIKLAAFFLPAAILVVGLRFAGPAIGSTLRRVFHRADHIVDHKGHSLRVPNDEWAKALTAFMDGYIAALIQYDLGIQPPMARFGLDSFTGKLGISVVDDEAYRELRPSRYAKHAGGFFDPLQNRITLLRREHPSMALQAFSRELALAVFHYSKLQAEWSPWLAEGMAVYFESPTPAFGGKKTDRLAEAAAALPSSSLVLLLRAGPTEFSGDGPLASQGYSLIHFLLNSPERAVKFQAYLEEERKPGRIDPKVFEEMFGPGTERAWREFK